MKFDAYKPSFSRGEVLEDMYGRVDVQSYSSALATCRNFFTQLWGGVSTRPGTRFLGRAKYDDKKCRLIPFKYSDADNYAMEFGDKYIRFWKTSGVVLDSNNVIYEVVSPYGVDDLDGLSYVQSNDVVWLFHKDYPPYTLTRYGAANWALAPFDVHDGPYLDENEDADLTVMPSTDGSYIKLTASGAVFTSDMIGWEFRVRTRISEQEWSATVSSGDTVTAGTIGPQTIFGEWNFKTSGFGPTVSDYWYGTVIISRRYNSGAWQIIRKYTVNKDRDLDITGDETLEGAEYKVDYSVQTYPGNSSASPAVPASSVVLQLHSLSHTKDGSVLITSVESDTVAHGTEVRTVEQRGVATSMWSAPAWGGANGYPRCGCFYDERLIMAGSKKQPQTLWASKIGAYNDFSVSDPVVADDSFTRTLAAREAFTILALVSMSDLLVLTDMVEFRIQPTDTTLSPTSFNCKLQSSDGMAKLTPEIISNRVFFVQSMSREVRDFAFSWESDGYTGSMISLLSSHLLATRKVVSLAFQRVPWSILWLVCDDGVLLGCTYLNEQQIIGWHRHDTNGSFESVCSVRSTEQNEVFFEVYRNGKRMIELLDHRDISDVTQAVCVDSALSYHGTAKSVFSGLDHLEGMTVSILAGGNELPQQTVTGGSITLSQSFTDVVVGLPYTCELETLGIEAELKTGTSQMVKKKLSGLGVRLLNSRGGEYGEDFEHMYEIPVHSGKQTTDPLPLFSGKKELSINGSYDRECRACIRTTRPLPMTILALVPEISVG